MPRDESVYAVCKQSAIEKVKMYADIKYLHVEFDRLKFVWMLLSDVLFRTSI